MKRNLDLALVLASLFLLIHAISHGQSAADGLYCTAGIQPDGYIDFSGLPPAPVFPTPTPPSYSQGSPSVTAILPVTGVPGLTATVTIPALSGAHSLPNTPAYTVNGGALTLNGLPGEGSTVLTITFQSPIAGISLNGESNGRFEYSYSLSVSNPTTGPGFAPFSTTAQGFTYDLGLPQTQSLQMVGLNSSFQTAVVQFSGNEYYSVTLSNVRVESEYPNPAKLIPTAGLQQWLRGETGVLNGVWEDQSGNGHNATPTAGHLPTAIADGRTCQAGWFFKGASSFDFNLPIAGWKEMTIFLVSKTAADTPNSAYPEAAAILWTEDARWGNTYISPHQKSLYARFGTTQTGNDLVYMRPGSIGQDFTITRAVHREETDELFVNGLRAVTQRGKFPVLGGVTGAGTIGKGINDTYFNGVISEILVYNRTLSSQETAQVESYLRNKFGTQ
jgi:hypothetical protein